MDADVELVIAERERTIGAFPVGHAGCPLTPHLLAARHCGAPMRFGSTPGRIARPTSRLGEHTVQALSDAGLMAGEIARLAADGAIIDDR